MQKVDMTLLFKSFALCALLLGSMISQVFCEKPAVNPPIVTAVPKSKEVAFTKPDLVSAINGLDLKYVQSQYDYASEICPLSAPATPSSSYAPKIVGDDVVFYLPKNANLDNYLAGTIDALKDALNQASTKHATYKTDFKVSNFPVTNVTCTAFKDFIKKFKFDGKKFVKIAARDTGFDINGDNFKNEIIVSVSGKLDDIFKNVQKQIDSKTLLFETDTIIDNVMTEISKTSSAPNVFVTLEDLFKKFDGLKNPDSGFLGLGRSGKKFNFADFTRHYDKFFIPFIQIKPETDPFFEFLSASVNELNSETNIKKILKKIKSDLTNPKPDFKKSIDKFIISLMNNDFSETTLKKADFNAKINTAFPKQVDFKVNEADIDDSFLNLKIPNVDGSDIDILNNYLKSLKSQNHFDNLKDLTMENFKSTFSLVQKEENINDYFDAHPLTNKPDEQQKDKQQEGKQQEDEQQEDEQQDGKLKKNKQNTANGKQNTNGSNGNAKQSEDGDNNQKKDSNIPDPTKPKNPMKLWLKLVLSLGGICLLAIGSIGGYVLIQYVKSKGAYGETQV